MAKDQMSQLAAIVEGPIMSSGAINRLESETPLLWVNVAESDMSSTIWEMMRDESQRAEDRTYL